MVSRFLCNGPGFVTWLLRAAFYSVYLFIIMSLNLPMLNALPYVTINIPDVLTFLNHKEVKFIVANSSFPSFKKIS